MFVVARALEPAILARLRQGVRRSGDGRRPRRLVRGDRAVPPPLGLPIPHTAIIPRNKDRIGEALANFLKENFLIPSVVARRMRNIDVAGAAGRFLQRRPAKARASALAHRG